VRTYKEFINENNDLRTDISSKDVVLKVVDKIRSLGYKNPLGNETIIDNVTVEVYYFDGYLHLSSIMTLSDDKKISNATSVMMKICKIADDFGVTIKLTPEPFGKKSLNRKDLIKWYKMFGFKHKFDYEDMKRQPKEIITEFYIFENAEKLFEKITHWEFQKDKYIYHYTSYENAVLILKDGFIRGRERTAFHKYTSSSTASADYGYISFTEDEEYHWDEHGGIPTDVRFVFDKKFMNKKYDLKRFDANEEADEIANDFEYDDLEKANNLDYYGEEYEVRVYAESVPISESVKIEYDENPPKKIIDLCKSKNIQLVEW
jgi:hypothetical protein